MATDANLTRSVGRMESTRSTVVFHPSLLIAEALAVALGVEGVPARPGLSTMPANAVDEARTLGAATALVATTMGQPAATIRELSLVGCRCAVLASSGDEVRVAESVDAGAAAVIDVTTSAAALAKTMKMVASGVPTLLTPTELADHRAVLDRARREAADLNGLDRLTRREAEVLGALMRGHRASRIAAEAFVSVVTVRNQIQSVLTKLNVHSQLEAVVAARDAAWSPPDRP